LKATVSDKQNDKPCPGEDRVVVGPTDDAGAIPFVRHRQDHSYELGVLTKLDDGKPLSPDGEVVKLTHIEENEYAVETVYKADSEASHGGPALVNTDAYRKGWEAIFKGHSEPSNPKQAATDRSRLN